jgi:hypothetical protein
MPTVFAAQLIETETPWLEIWNRMYKGLLPYARQILVMFGYYVERDLEVPSPDAPLTNEEVAELTPIASALTKAAVESQRMRSGVQVATLKKVAKAPSQHVGNLPAAIQWMMSSFYKRGEEKAGTFAMDIWGTDLTRTTYIRGEPTPENMSRAAEAAANQIQAGRSPGRPHNRANWILAENLGAIYRTSGQVIARHRQKAPKDLKGSSIYVESGPFYEFLEMVLPPLQDFLREHRLASVTIESIVRQTVYPV